VRQKRPSKKSSISSKLRNVLYENFRDYHVWGWMMLDKFNHMNPQPKNIPELKTALLIIWDELPQEAVRKSIVSFRKPLCTSINAKGGHFECKL